MKWQPDEFTGKRFGKYEVLCRLAVGGMAEIFLGFPHLGQFVGRPVVLKRILAEQREDPTALQMLLDEAKVTATLTHPNVAQVLDLEMAGEDVLLIIEFISGANVEELVDVYRERQELLPLGMVLSLIRDSAQGLGNAHAHKDARGQPQPIIHRDVTPRNLMVNAEGISKVLDFGIARAMGAQRRTVAGMVRGTTAYMSPEQAIGKELDPRTDLFSLGTIFHELLTGQRLFAKGNPAQEMAAVYEQEIPLPSKVNKRVPRAIDPVVMRALDRKRETRYQSAMELIRDLSLAAGSTAWPKERCGEVVRDRFAQRLSEIEALVARIPARYTQARSAPAAPPPYPEGRTVVTPLKPTPAATATGEHTGEFTGEQEARTVIHHKPIKGAAGPAIMPPPPAAQTDTGHPATPSLSEDQLFGDLDGDQAAERTRIIQGGSMRGLRPVPDGDVSNVPTDPGRNKVQRQGSGSRILAIVAVGVALIIGAGAGAYFMGRQAKTTPPVASIGRLTLTTDRPAEVTLGGQTLGKTPITNAFVPAGRHALQLREEDGTVRALDVDVPPGDGANLTVTLDTLAKVP